MIELLTYYVIVSVLFIGAPAVFFLIVFMPALQNTKGRMVGYRDYKDYGPSVIYEPDLKMDRGPATIQIAAE